MMATRTFPTKRVFFSALREASPISIILESAPLASKFTKERYCKFKVEGDDAPYELVVESPAVDVALQQFPKGQPITIAAAGARETAVLEVVGQEPPAGGRLSAVADTPRAQHNQRAAEIAASATNDTPAGDPVARDLWNALAAAHTLVEHFRDRHGREPSDAELRLAASLFISKRGGR